MPKFQDCLQCRIINFFHQWIILHVFRDSLYLLFVKKLFKIFDTELSFARTSFSNKINFWFLNGVIVKKRHNCSLKNTVICNFFKVYYWSIIACSQQLKVFDHFLRVFNRTNCPRGRRNWALMTFFIFCVFESKFKDIPSKC